MIVYCTTCKGRREHLEKTLPRNLADNAGYADAKFLVMDYSDTEGLSDYLRTTYPREIESGKLVTYRFADATTFHVSHAKNMAARCAILEGADILVTLDADNSTGPGFSQFIADKFRDAKPGAGIFLCPNFPLIQNLPYGPGRPLRGFAGRLAVRAQDFVKAGGYDETFDTWRGEDIDMIARLLRMGHRMHHIDIPFLNVIAHDAAVRFKEYPHAQDLYENKQQVPLINARKETVVNFGNWGVGNVYRNFSCTPVRLDAMPTRIFGIGMHKTGTTSLDAAFRILGFDSLHWGEGHAPQIWQEMSSTDRSKVLEQWYALSDLPIPLLYQKLDTAYPGSKFILTVRNERHWLDSVERLWDPRYNPTRWVWDKYPFTNRIHTELYGQKDFDSAIFLQRYRRHNAEVVKHFTGRPNDLLVLNIDVDEKWQKICRFLGVPVPSVPYPVGNPTRDLRHSELAESTTQMAVTAVGVCDESSERAEATAAGDCDWLRLWGCSKPQY